MNSQAGKADSATFLTIQRKRVQPTSHEQTALPSWQRKDSDCRSRRLTRQHVPCVGSDRVPTLSRLDPERACPDLGLRAGPQTSCTSHTSDVRGSASEHLYHRWFSRVPHRDTKEDHRPRRSTASSSDSLRTAVSDRVLASYSISPRDYSGPTIQRGAPFAPQTFPVLSLHLDDLIDSLVSQLRWTHGRHEIQHISC